MIVISCKKDVIVINDILRKPDFDDWFMERCKDNSLRGKILLIVDVAEPELAARRTSREQVNLERLTAFESIASYTIVSLMLERGRTLLSREMVHKVDVDLDFAELLKHPPL